MNRNLLFDFSVSKENKAIYVKRVFEANLDLVWKTWTTAELLDQWWAPHPYRNQTKTFNFKKGGAWHYAMISPQNETHWCRFDYEEIVKSKSFSGLDAFCDEDGNINTDFSRMQWQNRFTEADGCTEVDITIRVDTYETIEKIIAMGFKEGFTMGLNQLDELLNKIKHSV